MPKLTAIEYFVTAAKTGSLTKAAVAHHVSLAALSKQIQALEKSLAVVMFTRSRNGLTLTDEGRRYLDDCEPAILQLSNAAAALARAPEQPTGVLRVAGHGNCLGCLSTWLPAFHQRFPDLQLDLRLMTRQEDLDDPSYDVMIVQGWPDKPDLIQKVVAQPTQLTCAAPAFWARYGIPRHPTDISKYNCLFFVNVEGTINDLWTYEKAGQKVEVRPTGWLNCDNRAVTVEAAIAGHGVIRASDIVVDEQLHTGTLVPVLLDWHMLDTPAISVLYSQTRRENPKVRVFLDFVTEAFQQMQAHTGYSATPSPPSPLPYWHRPKYTHASAVLRAASGKKD